MPSPIHCSCRPRSPVAYGRTMTVRVLVAASAPRRCEEREACCCEDGQLRSPLGCHVRALPFHRHACIPRQPRPDPTRRRAIRPASARTACLPVISDGSRTGPRPRRGPWTLPVRYHHSTKLGACSPSCHDCSCPSGVARRQRDAGSSVSSSARISAPFHSRAPIAMPATSPPGFTRNVAGRLVTRQALDVARSGSSRIGNVSR